MSEPTPCPHCGKRLGPFLHQVRCATCSEWVDADHLITEMRRQLAEVERERDEALRVNAEQGERLRTALRNIADALPVPARLGDAPKQAAEAACEGDADEASCNG